MYQPDPQNNPHYLCGSCHIEHSGYPSPYHPEDVGPGLWLGFVLAFGFFGVIAAIVLILGAIFGWNG